MLEIHNIETYYDLLCAVRGVSLSVDQGSITAILGNNGAGKTTVLRTVMGLLDDQPDKGTISFEGRRIDGMETEGIVELGISYVPEGREVFEELTVSENLAVGGFLRGRQAEDDALNRFPVLRERRDQLAGTLSGGEQQMLAIARALMNQPKLLLLDEPSLGLSPRLVKEMFGIIRAIRDDGVTIVLVEQNARMALAIADHGYVLEQGRFVASGSAAELLEDEDVKEFYLGIRAEVSVKGSQRYKRKRSWR